jgi:Flp pilus assembly pilin Flp
MFAALTTMLRDESGASTIQHALLVALAVVFGSFAARELAAGAQSFAVAAGAL